MRREKQAVIPEKDVLKVCLDWLNLQPGVKCWRQNTGAFKASYGGKSRYLRFGQPGQGDISGIGPHGRRIEIECKRRGKKPTEDQDYWIDSINSYGGIAFWCDSLEACEEKYRAILGPTLA